MIQRIQSLYLLGVFVLSLLLLTGPLSIFSSGGEEFVLKHNGLSPAPEGMTALATWPMTVLFILVALTSFLNIFSYKNRVRQMRLSIYLIFVLAGMLGMLFFYSYLAAGLLDEPITLYQWRFVIPPVNIILLYLAFRSIRKDELLVKAYDRLR